MDGRIGPAAFHEAAGTDDWRVLAEGACAFFRTSSFANAVAFVRAIGDLEGLDAGHPDVDIRHDGVTVRLLTDTPDCYGMSTRDVELARAISAIAREQGIPSDPSVVQGLLIVPGAPDTAAVMPFWRAVLGYERRRDSPDEDLVDPRGRGAPFWFEPMREPRVDGGGAIHVAVWVAAEEAEARVAAALAAGGRLVSDHSPAWWTLADAYGNEADIATMQGRG